MQGFAKDASFEYEQLFEDDLAFEDGDPLPTAQDSFEEDQSMPSEQSKVFVKAQPVIELKTGYFFFATSKMRKIYNRGGLDLQLSGTFPIWQWLQGYLSVEYLQRHGKILNSNQKTSLWQIPVSVGLRPVMALSSEVRYYFTLGPRYFYIHQHNNSSVVNQNIARSGVGGFANTGFYFFPLQHLVIDVFGEYSYERISIHPYSANNVYGESTQVGGFSFGLGAGYAF